MCWTAKEKKNSPFVLMRLKVCPFVWVIGSLSYKQQTDAQPGTERQTLVNAVFCIQKTGSVFALDCICRYRLIKTNGETGGDGGRSDEGHQAGTCVSWWPSCHCWRLEVGGWRVGGGAWGVFVSITEQQTGPLEMKGLEWSQSKSRPAGGPSPHRQGAAWDRGRGGSHQWSLIKWRGRQHTHTRTRMWACDVGGVGEKTHNR